MTSLVTDPAFATERPDGLPGHLWGILSTAATTGLRPALHLRPCLRAPPYPTLGLPGRLMTVTAKLSITRQTFLPHQQGWKGWVGCPGPFIKNGNGWQRGRQGLYLLSLQAMPPSHSSQPRAPEVTWGPPDTKMPILSPTWAARSTGPTWTSGPESC